MDEKNEAVSNDSAVSREDRFLNSLADMHRDTERQLENMSRRIERMEKKTAGSSGDQLIDNKTIGMLIVISVIPIALQVIGMLVAKQAKGE